MCPKTEKFIRIFEFAGVCGRPRTSLRVSLHGNSYIDGDKVTFSCDGSHDDLLGKAELSCVGQTWDLFIISTIKITQALHYTKMWRGDLRKPQGLYEEAPSDSPVPECKGTFPFELIPGESEFRTKSTNQFIYVNTWDGVAPIIRAGGSSMKRMTIKVDNNTFQ